MKTHQILLTIIMLGSCTSTLFCSEIDASIKMPSYDATKLGWSINSTEWMLEHMGTTYKHYGKEHEVRPESDDESTSNGSKSRWTKIGKDKIKNVEHATTFLTWTKKLNLSEEANNPALNIIATDRQNRIAASKTEFERLQNQSRDTLSFVRNNAQQRNVHDDQRNLYYVTQINNILEAKKTEFENTYQERYAQDARTIALLKDINQKSHDHRTLHNQNFPDAPIIQKPLLSHKKIKECTPENITRIAIVYDTALKKANASSSAI